MHNVFIDGRNYGLTKSQIRDSMRGCHIVVIGAGFSGSLAAIMLDRLGFRVTLIDRYAVFPAIFAAEQLVGSQVKILDDLNVLNPMISALPLIPRAEAYTRGRRHRAVHVPHYGLPYQDMVQALRRQIPPSIEFVVGRVTAVTPGQHPTVHLDDGRAVTARLVVLATGLNPQLPNSLRIERKQVCTQSSITIGFDVVTGKSLPADQPVIVHFGNGGADRIDYLTVFRFRGGLRGNLFLYREMRDPWVIRYRRDPKALLTHAFPALAAQLGDFSMDNVNIRPMDVSVVHPRQLDGVLMVGDAFQSPCPAAGTGIDRLLVDVQRLTEHAVRWMAADCFSATAIASFYDDPMKKASDEKAIHDAIYRRGIVANSGLYWAIQRKKLRVRHACEHVRDLFCEKRPSGMAGSMAPLGAPR
jgi:2-polyprenyl-6-methoxyphenol hydroxylase-like FAD-dependent oxidoreductase